MSTGLRFGEATAPRCDDFGSIYGTVRGNKAWKCGGEDGEAQDPGWLMEQVGAKHTMRRPAGVRGGAAGLGRAAGSLLPVARKKVDLRREEIIEEMIVQMRERGISETRVIDVAKALGVSTGLIFYHFDTKEALLLEALPRAMERDLKSLAGVMARKETAAQRLKSVCALYAPAGDAAEWRLWIDSWGAALRNEQLAAVIRQIDGHWRSAILSLLREGVDGGEFSCADPEATAARTTALIDGLAIRRIVRREPIGEAETEAFVDQIFATEIAAV